MSGTAIGVCAAALCKRKIALDKSAANSADAALFIAELLLHDEPSAVESPSQLPR